MSLLTLVQRTCRRVGLAAPNAAYSSTDENIIRLVELANEEGDELSSRHGWQALTREATHTTVAAEQQGLITSIAGADFDRIFNETMWNRTQDRRWFPVDITQWQQMKASGITGSDYYFRIRQNYLIVQPTPAAGETVAFEWATKYWCESSGGTGRAAWGADDDVSRLPESLMLAGLVWRWKKAQGLEYAEDFEQYERRVASTILRDGAPKNINMGSGGVVLKNIPEGSWSL